MTSHTGDAKYRKDYLRGWNAAAREVENGQTGEHSTLERADLRDEVRAWYDGAMDMLCDREKFHTLNGGTY